MPKPGPKNNGKCPGELHLRLPEDARIFVESYGSGSANDRIVAALRELAEQKAPSTLPAIACRIKELKRKMRPLKSDLQECYSKLDVIIPDEIDQKVFTDAIESDLEKEDLK